MTTDAAAFEAVADALLKAGVDNLTKAHILAATMDVVGVPVLALDRYRHDVTIVSLFAARGVRYIEGATCLCGCPLGASCGCDDDAEHGDPRMPANGA